MAKPTRSELAKTAYDAHIAFVRRVNDAVIFLTEMSPRLEQARKELAKLEAEEERRYEVPSVEGTKTSRRTHRDVRKILRFYRTQGFAEAFLVTAVSQFESYLFGVLRNVITKYPKKLTLNVGGQEVKDRQVSLDVLLRADTLTDALTEIIEHRLVSASYAKPKEYLQYVKSIANINTDDPAFAAFIEIKATRDIIVHNGGVANETYVEKAGDLCRAVTGNVLPVDTMYFETTVATLKRCSGIISRDIDDTF
jgi:hypothetical protein